MRETRAPAADPDELYDVVPVDLRTPYDVREVISRLVDGRGDGTARRSTSSRSFTAPPGHRVRADPRTPRRDRREQRRPVRRISTQGRPLLELCDKRSIPLLFLQNISGFMVGRDYEAGGIAKHGAKMVTAVACARVPK